MKIGRNDPCPCGSGQKYKKCCLEKDEAAARTSAAAVRETPALALGPMPPLPPPPPPEPGNPLEEARYERWQELSSADYEGKIELVLATLAQEPDLIDGETVVEILPEVHAEAARRGERDRFDHLVQEIRQHAPEAYREEQGVLLGYLIDDALVAGREAELRDLGLQFAAIAHTGIDFFDITADQLAFHGRQALLLGMLQLAWPRVRVSHDIVPWGIEESGGQVANLVMFEALEQGWALGDGGERLVAALEGYTEVQRERYLTYLSHLAGQTHSAWTTEDLTYPSSARTGRGRKEGVPDREQWERNLVDLSGEFLHHLRREKGIPYCGGELGREALVSYLIHRADGDLTGSGGGGSAKGRRRDASAPDTRTASGVLCPDGETMDRFLGDLLHFLSPRHWRAAAVMAVIPLWLRFLESRQLIDAGQRERSLKDLKGVATSLHQVWMESQPEDPALAEAVAHWPEGEPWPAGRRPRPRAQPRACRGARSAAFPALRARQGTSFTTPGCRRDLVGANTGFAPTMDPDTRCVVGNPRLPPLFADRP